MSTLASIFDAGQMQTVLELGLITSLTVLALFLSYTMLNVCDLSTDGCFTLGAAVGAIVALNGHPILSIPLAMLAGVASGLITALLQTVLGIDSLLAGIVVNTGLYSINIAVMKKSSLLNLNSADTVFSLLKSKLDGTALEGKQTLIIAALAVFLIVLFLSLFLKTKLGLSIRATGNNPDMVKSSSINPIVTTIIGLCIANSFTALSGCLLAQSQKQAEINIGTGMVTVALASLLIGGVFVRRGKIPLRAIGAVIGAVVFRLVYQIAIGLHMPPFMLKFVSSVIVIIAIAGPYLKTKMPEYIRKAKLRSGKKVQ
ncbi:ABC transporter permease [uncultured Eubacterium sp.]|uniref:ABC transporter permease n=1 Tax=uncultured Eubacterium sp. TaxID=165185 RepID=UPI0025CCD1AE|nr:ABC transporter permease [uncultured Eubacterium sp.]